MSKIDEFKEYARKRIVDKLREKKDDGVIEAYSGEDSYYSGSDEDYKEFLDGLDVDIDTDDAEPVENTQKFNIGSNLKGVVDKVKETAARVTEKVNTEENEAFTEKAAKKAEDIIEDIKDGKISEKISETLSEKIENISGQIVSSSGLLDEIKPELESLSETVERLEMRIASVSDATTADITEIKHKLNEAEELLDGVNTSVNGMSKLNDSVFDLKNSQQNTKNAITDLQLEFKRLKKKTVTGIVILSIIGFIVIAMEVVNLLA